jgi:hypothetical protein
MDFHKEIIALQKKQEWAQQLLFDRHGKAMYALCRRYFVPDCGWVCNYFNSTNVMVTYKLSSFQIFQFASA